MRILPILFNTEMVRAIQDGRKTATRRAMKPQPLFYTGRKYIFDDKEIPKKWEDCDNIIETYQYQPGDILYVRETWGWEPCWACGMDVEIGGCIYEHTRVYNQKKREYGCYCHKASMDDGDTPSVGTWRPSIHMPRAAARIWLEVKDVRIERLQDIDDNGILAEGLEIGCYFEDLWDSVIKKSDIKKYGWDVNPWVWVIEFERREKPKSEKK